MSNMKEEEIKTLKLYATITHTLDQYVWLREDEQGRYIEYAFIDGAPHDNRCLSWYDKLQPNALKHNNHRDVEDWEIKPINEIYELDMFTCGCENRKDDKHCSPGHRSKSCSWNAEFWTYEEPVKCACWFLRKVHLPETVPVSIKLIKHLPEDEIKKLY